jgi:beta-ribofuranosylaminobenzene 5'-phosphate synthase
MAALTVTAPARLHLGFLDLNGSLGRRYGSLGLSVDDPATELTVAHANTFGSTGPERDRALKAAERYGAHFAPGKAFKVDVKRAIPAHAGLGSGTQLALAIGTAIIRLENKDHRAHDLGELVERGARSAIGITAFEQGGFIIDGGRGEANHPPPLLVRVPFPEDWRVILVLDPRETGVHGEKETKAFKALPVFPETAAGHLCRLTLMQLLPGLAETDLQAFGSALSEIQHVVGDHFAAAQGGTPWSSPAVGRIVKKLGEAGATGLGQSSWGPTGFAFCDSDAAARRLYSTLVEEAKAEGLALRIAHGRNSGALLSAA